MSGRAGNLFTEMNVTPLTDVFLVLLVVLLLIAPLSKSTVLKMYPPSFGQSQTPSRINVRVTADGRIILNGKTVVQPNSVAAAIQTEQRIAGKTDIPVQLQADSEALQKDVVSVMDACEGRGIKELNMLPLNYYP